MKRNEFIADLKEALEHNLSEQKIKEHVDYYEEYIRNEVKSGRTEEEVVNELGDPWAIAKTIRLSEGMESQETVHQTPEEPAQSEVKRAWNWKAILAIVVLGVIVLSLLSAFMGILGLVIRYAYPILIIVIVLRIMKRR
jgi:uncharacterized membrane protein